MEYQFKKHVRVVCDLKVGETVVVDKEWGRPIGGRKTVITEIIPEQNCESTFMLKIEGYPNPIDSNWVDRITNQLQLEM
jgi:hypothetical protein